MNDKRTEIKELGEFGLIDRIKSNFSINQPSTVLGIDDDAAVIDTGKNYLLVSTDMLLEGVHFDLSFMPLKHLGYKSVTVNVSDIAAMNGIPRQITVNVGISNRFSVEAIDEFYLGIKNACKSYKIDLVGGDTTASAAGLVVSVTIIGDVEKEKLLSAERPMIRTSFVLPVTLEELIWVFRHWKGKNRFFWKILICSLN